MIADETALERIVALREFEPLARAAMDPAAYDFVAGGAWDETTLADNEAAWLRRRLRPRVLTDVSTVTTASTMLGRPVSMPMAIAPMATQALARPDGELAMARAAASAGVPMIVSTASSWSIEEVAAAAPDAIRWFQLYVQSDLGVSRSLVERAVAAGYTAIVLTVDLPVVGYRERDRRWGFELPALGNFRSAGATHGDRSRGGLGIADQLETGLTWAELATIRSWSTLPIVLKGILTAEDARLAVEHGVDGIVVSNHGARQLDRVSAPVDVLEEIVDAVEGVDVWVDGGVRRGLDLAIALALGARGVLVGRPTYWALAAGGQAGVERALAILREEFEIAMALLGVRTPSEFGPGHLGR